MRRKTAIFSFLMVFAIAAFCLNVSSCGAASLVFQGDHAFPPYEFLDGGLPSGFNVDIVRALAEKTGMDITISLDSWETVRERLERGDIDGLIGMIHSSERSDLVSFTMPTITITYGIVVRSDSDIRTLDDLTGEVTIILQTEDFMDDLIRREGLPNTILRVDNPREALQMLSEGKGDCALLPRLTGRWLLKENEWPDITIRGSVGFPREYGLAVQKGDSGLATRINEGVAMLHASGEYDRVFNKWFGPPRTFSSKAVYGVLAAILVVLTAAGLWIIFLERAVIRKTSELRFELEARKKTEAALLESAEKRKQALVDIISAMARVVEVRDPYTSGHQERVSLLATAIAERMGWSGDRLEGIRVAAMLHDIGKITIPSEILSKPGRLSDSEINVVRQHPEAGADILEKIHFPWPVGDIVLQHHEKLDGSGYPRGLEGDDIMMEARILSVADVVEAMASHRPYRMALGIEAALKEIQGHRGSWFDPDVVDACLAIFDEGFSFD